MLLVSGDAIIHDAFRPSVTKCQSGLVRCSKNRCGKGAERESGEREVEGE
jgi:hypothetical protein